MATTVQSTIVMPSMWTKGRYGKARIPRAVSFIGKEGLPIPSLCFRKAPPTQSNNPLQNTVRMGISLLEQPLMANISWRSFQASNASKDVVWCIYRPKSSTAGFTFLWEHTHVHTHTHSNIYIWLIFPRSLSSHLLSFSVFAVKDELFPQQI